MAKGQLRSRREKKKPKQNKPKKSEPSSSSSQMNALFHKPAGGAKPPAKSGK